MEIGYCPRCNVPVLGKKCNICGAEPRALRFHDMGDIRPASPWEREKIAALIPHREVRRYLGRRVILLSKQPGLDYRKDVFVDGFKFGTFEYIRDGRWRWRFVPTGKGAALIHHLSGREDFRMEVKGHIKGKRLGREIHEDWEIFLSGECVGVAVPTEKGGKVRDVYCSKVREKRRAGMREVLQANKGYLSWRERRAVEFIRKHRPDYVAFSGGKDSEAALYLASMAGVKRAIYANTGLEFPETERFVYNFADYLGVELIEIEPAVNFWDMVDENGIPTKDNRWCTQKLKLEGLKKFKGTIVDGSRRYESLGRMSKGTMAKVGSLKAIYPILDWLALDVWLFIFWKELPYNPLYDMGYERIGCFMCPSMLNAEFHNLKRTHPELFNRWYNYLRRQGFSPKEIMDGTWRWKNLPAKFQGMNKS